MNKILSYLLLGVLIFDQINGQSFFRAKLREIKKNKDVQGTATSAKRYKDFFVSIRFCFMYLFIS